MASVRTAFWPVARLRPLPEPAPRPGLVPVVLVHGYMGHPEMMRPLARRLLRAGVPAVERVGYSSFATPFDEILGRIDEAVDRLGGVVDLVGHSLGGVACRAFLKTGDRLPSERRAAEAALRAPHDGTHGATPGHQKRAGRGAARTARASDALHPGPGAVVPGLAHLRVRRFVSLGAPFQGTSLYRLVYGPLRPVLDPRGDWVARIAEGPEPVPTTVIRARWDHQVVPRLRGRIEGHDREIVLDGQGHNGLLWSREAHDAVIAVLSEP